MVGSALIRCRPPVIIDLGVVTLRDGVVLGLNNRNLGVDPQIAQTAVETMPRQLNKPTTDSVFLLVQWQPPQETKQKNPKISEFDFKKR